MVTKPQHYIQQALLVSSSPRWSCAAVRPCPKFLMTSQAISSKILWCRRTWQKWLSTGLQCLLQLVFPQVFRRGLLSSSSVAPVLQPKRTPPYIGFGGPRVPGLWFTVLKPKNWYRRYRSRGRSVRTQQRVILFNSTFPGSVPFRRNPFRRNPIRRIVEKYTVCVVAVVLCKKISYSVSFFNYICSQNFPLLQFWAFATFLVCSITFYLFYTIRAFFTLGKRANAVK